MSDGDKQHAAEEALGSDTCWGLPPPHLLRHSGTSVRAAFVIVPAYLQNAPYKRQRAPIPVEYSGDQPAYSEKEWRICIIPDGTHWCKR
jgi:hypothetical protein